MTFEFDRDRALLTRSNMHGWNGNSWDGWRANENRTVLVSEARTETTTSAPMTNHNCRGILAYLEVTAVGATGGLELEVQGKDTASGNWFPLYQAASVSATGKNVYIIYPGAENSSAVVVAEVVAGPIPRDFRISIKHGDSTSYTYSVGVALIN